MSNNAGNIAVGLVLNGAEAFIGRVDKSSKSLDKYGKAVKGASDHTETWLHKTRDAAIVLGLARSAVENLSLLFTGIPRAILAQNAQLERSQVLIAGMDKSANSYAEAMEKAADTVDSIVAMSSSSPFAVQSIADSFAKLQAAGIKDTAQSLESLVDAAAKAGTNSEGLKRASVAIQQMAGKGVISMEELRQQLGESIPTAMQIMSRATGMRMAEMTKLIATGTMEANSSLNEFFKEMAFSSMGAGEAMAQTLEGIKNRITNDFIKLAKAVGDSGFNDAIKEIGNELDEILNSREFIQLAEDLGKSLATISTSLFEISKLVGENIKLIGAFGAALIGMKLINGTSNKLAAFWTEASAAGKRYSSNVERYMRRTNKLIELHQAKMVQNEQAMSARFMASNNGVVSERLADQYRAYTNHLNATHEKTIEKIRSTQRAYTSAAARIKRASIGMFNAMGGWTTVISAGITAAIYLLDEFIWKQQRAAEAILRTNGIGASAEQVKDASTHLDRIANKIAKLEADRARQIQYIKDNGTAEQIERANNGQATAFIDRQIQRLQDEKKAYEYTLKNAREDLARSAFESGRTGAERLIYQSMNEISLVYQKAEEEMRKGLEDKGLTGEAFSNAYRPELEKLREQAVQSLSEVSKAEIASVQKLIDKIKEKNVIDDKDKEQIKIYEGQIKGLEDAVISYQNKIRVGDIKTLTMSQDKMSAEDKLIAKYKKTEAIYTHRLSRLKDEVKYGENLLKLEEDIAAGKYKYSNINLEAARKEAMAADAAIDKHKKIKALLAQRSELNDKLNEQFTSLTKKAAKSASVTNNEFMKWEANFNKNAAALKQIEENLKKVNAARTLTTSQQKKFDEAAKLNQQIALNTIINQHKEYQRTLNDDLLSSTELQDREYRKTISDLIETQNALKQMLSTQKEGTAEWLKTKEALDKVSASLDQTVEKAKKVHPVKGAWDQFVRDVEDADTTLQNGLHSSMTSFFDDWAESIWETDATFSDAIDNMVKSVGKLITKLLLMKAIESSINSLSGSFGSWFGGSSQAAGADFSAIGGSSSYGGANFFAKGGVMTPEGSLPLRKYANGGIATSPQVAVFGEGKQNEAYVPLPDGKTIPVTMQGGGGQAPVVNVINQTGIQSDTQQTSRFDGEKWVTDVVMKAASRPGKFRDALNKR